MLLIFKVVGWYDPTSFRHVFEELGQIQQFVLLYPAQGGKGPPRTATVLSKQTQPQQSLAD